MTSSVLEEEEALLAEGPDKALSGWRPAKKEFKRRTVPNRNAAIFRTKNPNHAYFNQDGRGLKRGVSTFCKEGKMSVDLNRNGAALKAAYEEVIDDKSDTTWFV